MNNKQLFIKYTLEETLPGKIMLTFKNIPTMLPNNNKIELKMHCATAVTSGYLSRECSSPVNKKESIRNIIKKSY